MINIKSKNNANSMVNAYFITEDDHSTLPKQLKKTITNYSQDERFKHKVGATKIIDDGKTFSIVVTLGKSIDKVELEDIRKGAFNLVKILQTEKTAEVDAYLPTIKQLNTAIIYQTLAEIVLHALYVFDKYQSEDVKHYLKAFNIIAKPEAALKQAIEKGRDIGESINITKYLVDEPAQYMTPKQLASEAEENGKAFGFDVEVIDEKGIVEMGMMSYMAVAKGSAHRPHLIVMRYQGNPKSEEILGFVGKGLTYDSGGYSIKSSEGMLTMKTDMAGSAVVIGAMCAIAKAKLNINVTAVVAACENAISATAYRPGDVLKTMNGKTIICENTDAEGRLTLVDAITYIQRKEGVNRLVDIATLTGAAVVSLGDCCALTVSNNDDFYNDYQQGAQQAGEKVWRMPMFSEYEKQVKHKLADYTNMGGRPGAITAAALLKAFVEDEKPWIHVDIAGVSYRKKAAGYYGIGATGYGVKSFYAIAEKLQQK